MSLSLYRSRRRLEGFRGELLLDLRERPEGRAREGASSAP